MSVVNKYDDIIKSETDSRVYRGLELSNGMKVMLVSDPTTEKAAAAMDVNIGMFYCSTIKWTVYDTVNKIGKSKNISKMGFSAMVSSESISSGPIEASN